VPGPNWSDDQPHDAARIAANVAVVLDDAAGLAVSREALTDADLRRWHQRLYVGCQVPSPAYLGRFRGEDDPALVDYEVGVGPVLADQYPDRVGVWAGQVAGAVERFFAATDQALQALDAALPPGHGPQTVDDLHEVVAVVAVVHGEWVRIHPFVNGNGRTARLLAAHVSLRYGLPVFVTLKPRPDDIAYARAARASMGRPPDFTGDHSEATAVFTHLLALHLLDG
jgi:fido (protein-threonine AMPylation protein)